MSVASDLASAFAEREVTHPVSCGGASTRAFFDRAGTVRKSAGVPIQIERDTLYIITGALDPDLVQEVLVTLGDVGADDATGGTLYRATQINLVEDGAVQAITLAGGAS